MESGLGFIDKYELTLTCIMFNFLFKICITDGGYSSLFVETELPIFYGMEVANETTASSPLLCSLECLKIGCVGFLFKTDDFIQDDHCFSTPTYFGYSGTVAETINGNICQNWADQTPHQHTTIVQGMIESRLTDAKNYCRDPLKNPSGFTWCFTMDPNTRWEPCDIYQCLQKNYIMDEASCHPNVNSSSYNGTLAITAKGNICQNWADQTPHQHNTIARRMPESSLTEARNYCRDPKPISAGFTWCYTVNPNARWEPCNPCTSGNMTCRLFSTRNTTHGTSEYREGYRYFNRTSYHTFT